MFRRGNRWRRRSNQNVLVSGRGADGMRRASYRPIMDHHFTALANPSVVPLRVMYRRNVVLVFANPFVAKSPVTAVTIDAIPRWLIPIIYKQSHI